MQPEQDQNQPQPTQPPVDPVQPQAAPEPAPQPSAAIPEQLTAQTQSPAPQMVYVTRPSDPGPAPVSEAARQRHDESMTKYPTLNLSDGEYIVSAVRRHPVGLVPIFGLVGILLIVLAAAVPFYDSIRSSGGSNLPPTSVVAVIAALLGALVAIGGYVAVYVYTSNKFFLTNESVIQEIQTSLFARHEQTVSLVNIEDASFEQKGILPYLLNYGSIRLSTEGDETTYRFNYVTNPKKEIATLNNAVEAFKNGRPVVND